MVVVDPIHFSSEVIFVQLPHSAAVAVGDLTEMLAFDVFKPIPSDAVVADRQSVPGIRCLVDRCELLLLAILLQFMERKHRVRSV